MMKIYQTSPNGPGFSISEAQDDLLFEAVTCAGTTLVTAPQLISVGNTDSFPGGYIKMSVLAHYVDAGNYAVVLPSILSVCVQEVVIWADAPSGSSITVFAPSGDTFVGGGGSVTINGGQGKIFTRIESYPSRVWATIG